MKQKKQTNKTKQDWRKNGFPKSDFWPPEFCSHFFCSNTLFFFCFMLDRLTTTHSLMECRPLKSSLKQIIWHFSINTLGPHKTISISRKKLKISLNTVFPWKPARCQLESMPSLFLISRSWLLNYCLTNTSVLVTLPRLKKVSLLPLKRTVKCWSCF